MKNVFATNIYLQNFQKPKQIGPFIQEIHNVELKKIINCLNYIDYTYMLHALFY